jgi:nucleoside phosphorylase
MADLLIQTGKIDDAIALLNDGLTKIPVSLVVRYKLIEALLNILLAKQDIEAMDDLMSSTNVDARQKALSKVYKLIIAREWETAAELSHQEQSNLPFYRPLMQTEAFCWLCAQKPRAADEVLEKIVVQDEPFETIFWLRAWVALKLLKRKAVNDNLSIYMNRPMNEHELNEEFLLELWDTPPTLESRTDLAYHFPILPTSLTGLPYDAIRREHGPRVIMPQHLNRTELGGKQYAIQEEDFSSRNNNQFSSPTWMADLLNSSGTKSRADIGIVIALEEEFRELAPQIIFKPYYNQDIKQYYYLFERGGVDQEQTPYHCVVTFIGAMGPTDAGIVGDRLISQFNPKTIISIGIAGSTDKDVLVGNVVVADQTDEYLASSKAVETSDKQDWDFQFSGNPFKSDPAYVAHAMNLKYAHNVKMQEWERNCKQNLLEKIGSVTIENLIRERLIGDFPEIQTGHIASGPTVGAAKQFVQWLKDKHDRKLLALEMESAGILNAAHKRAVSSLIIRGISDYSDDRKNKLDGIGQGVLRRYAMNNALGLLWVLMELRLI